MSLKQVVSVFDEIKETSGLNDKKEILHQNKDFELFRKMLEFLYNPFMLTGIKNKKLNKFAHFKNGNGGHNVTEFSNVFEAIKYITEHNSGRDEDVMAIANYINLHEGRVHDFLQDFFTKDLKIGVTASTINKVYGKNTIPKFDVMLAKKYEDEEKKVTGEFYVTEKLDGVRCVAIKEDKSVTFFTRQGQPIQGLIEIEDELANKFPPHYVFDGELLLDNPNNLPSDDLFRATQKVVRKDGNKIGLSFHVFDTLPVSEFMEGKSTTTYSGRRETLENMFEPFLFFKDEPPERIKLVPVLYKGSDKNEIYKLLDDVVTDGKEGLMVNVGSGYYVTKRTHGLLKVKKMNEVDLEIVGFEEGTGKYKNTLGAIIVEYKSNDVKVGSGFSEEDRYNIWNNRENVLGKIATIQYFEESKNQNNDLVSLRFPVFKGLRFDKSKPSYN